MATARRLPVVCDVNLLVDALVADDEPETWPAPPPVRGDASAMTVAVLNGGLEFGLWLSRHTRWHPKSSGRGLWIHIDRMQ